MSRADDNCQELPPVPKWWWDCGMQQELDRLGRHAAAFDKIISDGDEAMTTDWSKIPNGLFLLRMFHESIGREGYRGHCLHLKLKVDDRPWYDQPQVPISVNPVMKHHFSDFWAWAAENLPIFDYQEVVKAA